MDKTIEEIAIESRRYHKDESFKTFNKELTFHMDDWAYGYCQGATEQDLISYLQGRNDALKEMADVMEKNKREMIDKFCEWLRTDAPITCPGAVDELEEDVKQMFKEE